VAKSDNNPAIGLLGGTFDPVHFGHLRSALDVADALSLDQVRLIPCSVPPHRQQPIASAAERRLLLELGIKNHPLLTVDDRELHRDGPSYTMDTLLDVRADFPDNPLFLIVGTDAFSNLTTWSRWEQLLDVAHIVVMTRPDSVIVCSEVLQNWFETHQAKSEDRSNKAGSIWTVDVTQMAISATQIRAALQQGKDVRYWLPDAVITLIEQLGLYSRTA
jgi:nicotinate-nucleotide adenylyltransferase